MPTASTLWQPPRTAATIWLTPTPKHEQTVAPGSGLIRARPAGDEREALAQVAVLGGELRRSPSCARQPTGSLGRGRSAASRRAPSKKASRRSPDLPVGIAERLDIAAGIRKGGAAPASTSPRPRRSKASSSAPAALGLGQSPIGGIEVIAALPAETAKRIVRRLKWSGRDGNDSSRPGWPEIRIGRAAARLRRCRAFGGKLVVPVHGHEDAAARLAVGDQRADDGPAHAGFRSPPRPALPTPISIASRGCSSAKGSAIWAERRALLPVRVIVCHWSRMRPVLRREGIGGARYGWTRPARRRRSAPCHRDDRKLPLAKKRRRPCSSSPAGCGHWKGASAS